MTYVKCACGEIFKGKDAYKQWEKHRDKEVEQVIEEHIDVEFEG